MVLGYLADVVGRLPILIVANLIAMTGNLLTIWSTNVTLFCMFRMISGIATDSNFVMMYILGERIFILVTRRFLEKCAKG